MEDQINNNHDEGPMGGQDAKLTSKRHPCTFTDRFFDYNRKDFSETLCAKFQLTNVEFLHSSQFCTIYVAYKGRKEKPSEEYCIEKAKKRYVLKVFQFDHSTEEEEYPVLASKEITYLSTLKHKNICKFYGHRPLSTEKYNNGCYVLKLEFLEISLEELLLNGLITSLDLPQMYRLFRHMTRALKLLHGKGIVHNEVHPKNIRIKSLPLVVTEEERGKALLSCQYKLCNFTFAQSYSVVDQKEALQEEPFSGQYRTRFWPPEKCHGNPYNPFSGESYSLAMVLLFALLGNEQLDGELKQNEQTFRQVIDKYTRQEVLDVNMANLLMHTLVCPPGERLDMTTMKKFAKVPQLKQV